MMAPTATRAIQLNGIHADATTTTSPVFSTLSDLLCAMCTASAFVRDALLSAVASVATLFQPTASTTTATATTPATTIADVPVASSASIATTTVATRTPTVPRFNAADERPITARLAPHNIAARAALVDPNMPDIVEPNVLRAFDELLVPPPPFRGSAAAVAEFASGFATSIGLQSALARTRIRKAYRERLQHQDQEPPAYTTYACGCGWCPNHTAAYPLCAAVTIRRRMRACGGNRAAQSPASTISRRQNMCGYRDATAAGLGGHGRTRG